MQAKWQQKARLMRALTCSPIYYQDCTTFVCLSNLLERSHLDVGGDFIAASTQLAGLVLEIGKGVMTSEDEI